MLCPPVKPGGWTVSRGPEKPVGQAPSSGAAGKRPAHPSADAEHHRRLRKARQARVGKALVVLAILVLLIVFVIQNSQLVTVHFIFAAGRARLIWVIVACAALGGIVGYLLGRPSRQVRLHDKSERKIQSPSD